MRLFSKVQGALHPTRVYGVAYHQGYFVITITKHVWEEIIVKSFTGWFGDAPKDKIEAYFKCEFSKPTLSSTEFGAQNCCKIRTRDNRVRLFFPFTKDVMPKGRLGEEEFENIRAVGLTLSNVFRFLNTANKVSDSEVEVSAFPLGDNSIPQLFEIETYVGNGGYHSGGFNVYFTSTLVEILNQHSNHDLLFAKKAMIHHYVCNLRYKSEINLWSEQFRAHIRQLGTLDYRTTGDCACLGAMPDADNFVEGLKLDTHNVDTLWQQFNLLVGVARTVNWLEKEYLKKPA